MRTASFRDDVLWAIARKLGLDPATEFLTDEGESYASYINAWVRRSWDGADFPEWATIKEFAPDTNHMVPYRAFPVGAPEPVTISRPLKVYLVDPRRSPYPIDTHFRTWDEGLHVGFDHGGTVWIKYIGLAPKFTSIKWDPNKSYENGELAYSPRSGECYSSLVAGNLGNDPVVGFATALPTQITQTAVPPDPGLAGQPEIMDAFTIIDPPVIGGPPENPATGTVFHMIVQGTTGTTLADVTYTVVAENTYDDVINGLANLLNSAPGMAGFTITPTPANKQIRLTSNSDFKITTWTQTTAIVVKFNKRLQVQSYVPAVPPSPGQPQITQVTISGDQARGNTTYTLTFRAGGGNIHTASYYAAAGEGLSQIINGLAAAINGSPDPWFEGVSVSVDPVLGTITISSMGGVSTDAQMIPEDSTYWARVLFPYALIEPVVDGAYADALREAGQTDKAMAEQQNAATDFADRVTKALVPGYNDLTDQRAPAPRYQSKLPAQGPPK